MIDEIRVSNVALITSASMQPSPGMTVLTGETGAGKTALLSACKLLIGERADKSIVREGENVAEVEARLFGRGGDEESELVITRRVGADGRSRATIDGHMASVKELAAAVSPTIDLCGQHEHQQLMKTASHLGILDAWAADTVAEPLAEYREALTAATHAAAELERIREASEASAAKLDEARFVLARINEVDMFPGEAAELATYLSKAENAEALAIAANTTHACLSGDSGAIDAIETAAQALESVTAYDEGLGAYAESLRETIYVLEDVARDAISYRDGIDIDMDDLRASQERMATLQGLMRTYGPREEDVFAKRDAAAETVALVDNASEVQAAAERAVAEAEAALAAAADALDAAREDAAPAFAEAVTKQMARLEMGSAELACESVRLERAKWNNAGPSSFEFLFRPGADMQARPLARIASGGEVSRVMLAIKVVLGEADEVETLVFDEVDAGVGGATAVALANVLADLAKTHQVLVVTHLPQVAVKAQVHYVVKKTEADRPETQLQEVTGDQRVCEIARMLSGSITDTSLAHAKELLEQA